MRRRKGFEWSKDKYYFTIKSIPNNITMNRSTQAAAADTFARYKQIGKQIEWLGKWDGKKFIDVTPPSKP